MTRRTMLSLAAVLGGALLPQNAAAVDLALVLLNDVSKSMDAAEYSLVKAGYRAAFSDPEVIAAILGNGGGVAVAYVEFSGKGEVALVKGFDVLIDSASSMNFGEAVAAAPRTSAGETALAFGISQAANLLTAGGFDGARLVIDVASDHPSDGGRSASARNAAVAAGITINALPILDDGPIGTIDGRLTYAKWGSESMIEYYTRNVIGGAGSFLVEARNIEVFTEALKRKLLLELIATGDEELQTAALAE